MDDRRLPLGKVGHVAAHVVEQEGEVLDPGCVELGELGASGACQSRLRVEVELERAEADAEAHAGAAAGLGEGGELAQLAPSGWGSCQRRRRKASALGA